MKAVLTAVLVAAAIHAAAWTLFDTSVAPPDAALGVDYVSYSPSGTDFDPMRGDAPAPAQIKADLARITDVARGIRTYWSTNGMEVVPGIAESYGLNVTLGSWIGSDDERNAREIENLVDLARKHRNVRSLMVGNEVLLRAEKTPDEMVALIKQVKRQVRVPVSTGEIWPIWLANPQLVNAVDFMAVHILPYWEGIPADRAIAFTLEKLDLLRKTYPGKPIVIAEFGWPSQGNNVKAALADPLTQAQVVRDFLREARRLGIEYNLMEAFDQPWKTDEGSVGPYWGIFDADRQAKFPLVGAVETTGVVWKAAVALVLGAVLAVAGLAGRRPTWRQALAFAVAANTMAAAVAMAIAYPFENYLNVGTAVMWGVGFVLVLALTVITLGKVLELTEVAFGREPRRLIDLMPPRPLGSPAPKVSIHVAAYREPPQMMIETLNSLAALDYPDFEVVVAVNNTPEPDFKAPVATHCRALGPRFKYLDVEVTGFKAGALNVALDHTDPAAAIIAVIDADYVVEPTWLKDLVPHFDDPSIGLVQAPQDHRDGAETLLKSMMNTEYAGFFDIGMVQRNEDDAIIQHGTMCMVRRSALDRVGGWGTDTIVEDTELGLRLFEAGYRALYTVRRYGRGLLPDTFKAFKTQRFRWAFGATQIIRKHWSHMAPHARTLTPAQKFHFLTGWALWLSDAMGSLAALLNLLWVPALLFVGVLIPTTALTVPMIAAFAISVVHCVVLYRVRVRVPFSRIVGAAIAAMSLQWTVARAVATGVIRDRLPFKRTEKGGHAGRPRREKAATQETVVGVLLALSSLVLVLTNKYEVTELNVFALALAIQSVPFLAATAMELIGRFGVRARPMGRPSPAAGRRVEAEPRAEAAYVTTFPGLSRPAGSRASLTARIMESSTSDL